MARRSTTQTIYRAMTYTTRDDWTPTRAKSARRAAETGNLTLASDLIENMLADDRINGVASTRTRGLIRLPITFHGPDSEDSQTPQSEALKDDFWTAYPEQDLDQLLTWGILLGVALAEHRWELDDDTSRLIPRLHLWSPRWLRYDANAEAWRLRTRDSGEITIEPGDGKWILYTPYGANRPWQRGMWRSLVPWWLLKRYAQLDWATYSEAHGNPTRVGTTPEGSSKEEREELASDLENMAGVTGLALPPGFDYKLVEATARTFETFEKQIETADTAIAIALTGQNLTTEVSGGSFAAAKVHEQIRHDLIESDEQTLSTTLHEQSIRWWSIYNFGTEDETPWARWDTTPPDAELPEYMLKYGLVRRNEARARVGLEPLEEGGDEFVQAPSPPPAMGGPPEAAANTIGHVDVNRVRLASGATGRNAPGFVRGQMYIDRMADRDAAPLGILQDNLSKLTAFINRASSYDEILEGLPRVLEGMDPDDAAGLMEALILADLAGRQAVHDDL